MLLCRQNDPGDPRMAAYFDGRHHPQQALPQRVGYVAMEGGAVVGYIAGHLTTRNQCDGEVQYLFVASSYRRRGIATNLLHLLAEWFVKQSARKVCVAIARDSPVEARPFVESVGAVPLQRNWHGWNDIRDAIP